MSTAIKGAALVGLIVAAVALHHDELPAATAAAPVVPHGLALVPAFAIAMQGIVFSYDSYYAVVYCGEELREPGRTIPRSIFRGLAIVIALYVLVNAAFLVVVPAARAAGDELVGAMVARLVFGARGDAIIRAIMIVAVLGTVNAQILATPRIVLAMARDGLAPTQAMRVNAGGTPTIALVATLALVGAFLATGSFGAVLAIDVFFVAGLYITTFAALFVLRRREPDAPRPYRAWGYPVVPALAIAFALALLVAMAIDGIADAVVAAAVVLAAWLAGYSIRLLSNRNTTRLGAVVVRGGEIDVRHHALAVQRDGGGVEVSSCMRVALVVTIRLVGVAARAIGLALELGFEDAARPQVDVVDVTAAGLPPRAFARSNA